MVALGDCIILDGFSADPAQILILVLLCLRLGSRDIGSSIGIAVYLHSLCVWIRCRISRHSVFGLCAALPSSTAGASAPAIGLALSLNRYIGHDSAAINLFRRVADSLHEAAALEEVTLSCDDDRDRATDFPTVTY